MAEPQKNPLELVLWSCDAISKCARARISDVIDGIRCHDGEAPRRASFGPPLFGTVLSFLSRPSPSPSSREKTDGSADSSFPHKSPKSLTKEELGRCTWTLLHAIAAQYPDHPTKQQRRDVKELMAIMSRLHPCKDCADHFKEVLKSNPVQAGSQTDFSMWLCHVHNVVNKSIGKPVFPCNRVTSRWGKLECEDRGCDVESAISKLKL